MKKNILLVLLGMLIMACISIGVYAINAGEIDYKNTNVESALDTLYTTQNNTVTDLTNQVSSLETTNTELSSTIQTLNQRLSSEDEVIFGSFNANQEKTYSITTNFKPSKVFIVVPNSTTGYHIAFTYDSSMDDNVYDCFTDTMNVNGVNQPSSDGCAIANYLLSTNNTGFSYTTVATSLGTTYWYAIK